MSKNIQQAFHVLLKFKELGTTDAQNINTIIPELDKEGMVGRDRVIELLFAQSKNPDGAYRNFVSRIKSAIAQAVETATRQSKDQERELLQSFQVNKIGKSKTSAGSIQFIAHGVEILTLDTVNANRDYNPDEYIPSSGSDTDTLPPEGTVKLFVSYAVNDKFTVERFIEQFAAHCAVENRNAEHPISHWSMEELVVGENFDAIVKESLNDADYGLALLSESFFDSRYITEVELEHLLDNDKLLPIGLISEVKGKCVTTKKFRKHILKRFPGKRVKQLFDTQIFYLTDRQGDFFADCDGAGQEKFIQELYREIQQSITRQQSTELEEKECTPSFPSFSLGTASGKLQLQGSSGKLELLEKGSQAGAWEPVEGMKAICAQLPINRINDYNCEEFIQTRGERGLIATASGRDAQMQIGRNRNEKDTRHEALKDMFDWLKDSQSSLYGLLGDYGMGKTFTCRMFALQLAEKCKDNPELPRPVYMDLRDVPTFVTVNNVTRQPTLEEMLETILRFSDQSGKVEAQEIIKAAQQGKQLLIFDGLDEKLVYYTGDMRNQFLRELLRVFPQDQNAQVKIVISCRTHHFETVRKMDGFLLGLGRSGVKGEDYRVLNLLPFSSSQILQLLTRTLGRDDANRVFSFIDNEQYLKDLAQRPFILKQLSSTLPELQKLKDRGLPINAASFYEALIADSINRDEEKHIIKPRHKRRLLMALAAEFWRESSQKYPIDDLNDWFCDWLNNDRSLSNQYRDEDSGVMERDLRNSTLLVRFGDEDFGFSHSSMQEYFLAGYLLNKWQQEETFTLDHPISNLSKRFIIDSLSLLSSREKKKLHQGMTQTLALPFSPASDLALQMIREMAEQGLPLPALTTVDLRGATLFNRLIKGLRGETLLLDGSDCHNSRWLDCWFDRAEWGKTNLNDSLWQRSGCTDTDFPETEALTSRLTLADCPAGMGETATGYHRFPARQPTPCTLDRDDVFPATWRCRHTGSLNDCSFSPDGTRIVSASADHSLKLWDLDGKCLNSFAGHDNTVLSCSFSPDGTRILSASSDSTLKLWDLEGKCLRTFAGHKNPVWSCTFSPDGTRIFSASNDHTLKLWDLEGSCLHTCVGHKKEVRGCSFSPDGTCIASASDDYTLKLWDLEGNCLHTFAGHKDWVMNCTFNPDGTRILSASGDYTLKLWDLEGNCLHTFEGHENEVKNCSFNPNGTRILSASFDSTFKLWDLVGKCLHTFVGHEDGVWSCSFSPDGIRIVSASYDNTLKLWDLEGSCIHTFGGHENEVSSCSFNLYGTRIVSVSSDRTLKLWDLTGNCLHTFKGHENSVQSCSFSPDGTRIVSASYDSTLKLWDLNGNCLHTFAGHEGWVLSCSFSPDGTRIVSASLDSTLKLWDLDGNCLHTFAGHEDRILSCSFSPDGIRIVSASFDSTLKLWDLEGNCLHTYGGHEDRVWSCSFSPDGTRVVSASSDRTLKLWDLTGNCLHTFKGHENSVQSCSFSPDGTRIVSASSDSSLKLWDLEGNCLHTFVGHENSVRSCSFSPDGTKIISGSTDGTVRIWNIADGTTEAIYSSAKEQWYSAMFHNNRLQKITGTELSWKMANLTKGNKTWFLDDLDCFTYHPGFEPYD